jgi:hypothetical protein
MIVVGLAIWLVALPGRYLLHSNASRLCWRRRDERGAEGALESVERRQASVAHGHREHRHPVEGADRAHTL